MDKTPDEPFRDAERVLERYRDLLRERGTFDLAAFEADLRAATGYTSVSRFVRSVAGIERYHAVAMRFLNQVGDDDTGGGPAIG